MLMSFVILLSAFLPGMVSGQETASDVRDNYELAFDLTTNQWQAQGFYRDPSGLTGRLIYFAGGYHQNLNAHQAAVAILPGQPSTQYIAVMETSNNYADRVPWMFCVVKVLGTTTISQGSYLRQVPHLEEVECAPQLTSKEHFAQEKAREAKLRPPKKHAPEPSRPYAHTPENDKAVRAKQRESLRQRFFWYNLERPIKDRYLLMVESAVAERWHTSMKGLKSDSATAKFRIDKTGEISNIEITDSTGNPQHDALAKEAIRSVNPLPPFHEDMTEEELRVTFKFQ